MPLFHLSAAERALAQTLLTRARDFNTRSVPEGSVRLALRGRPVGFVSREAHGNIAASPLAPLFVSEGGMLDFRPEGDADAALAHAARVFLDAGFFFQWRDELLDVRDAETDAVLARAERGLFRWFGMATRCVYAVGMTQDERLFLCRRSLTKQVDPGLWDALAAGLIAAGESPDLALTREIAEEAGLSAGQYRPIGTWRRFAVRRPVEEGWMHEDAFTLPVLVENEAAVHNTDGEVIAIECVSAGAVLERIEADLVPWDTAVAFLTTLLE